jgi:hypothetical protein
MKITKTIFKTEIEVTVQELDQMYTQINPNYTPFFDVITLIKKLTTGVDNSKTDTN